MSLSQAVGRLDSLIDWERCARGQMRADLAPITDLLYRIGNPERRFRSVHVTGTKGKGSVCALVEAGLAHSGWRVGRYASPHIERINERISHNCELIDDAMLAKSLTTALDARTAACDEDTAAAESTWFDVVTAAAFLSFAWAKLDWAVIEVGLGGRLDSTNVIESDIAIVTNVGLEHTEVLGSTVEKIAFEKAGIVKSGSTLVTSLSPVDGAGRVVYEAARLCGASIYPVSVNPAATISQRNWAVARGALNALGVREVLSRTRSVAISEDDLPDSVASSASLPGRLERFRVCRESSSREWIELVVDGAHVGFAVADALIELRAQPALSARPVVLLALAADKDADAIVSRLVDAAAHVVCSPMPDNRPGWSAEELAAVVTAHTLPASVAGSPRDALHLCLRMSDAHWILVTGSLYLAGSIRRMLLSDGTVANG